MSRNSVLIVVVVGIAVLVGIGLTMLGGSPSPTSTTLEEGVPAEQRAAKEAATPSAPSVITVTATDITESTAVLHGTIVPNGSTTVYWFEYSADPLLGAVLLKKTPLITLTSAKETPVEAKVVGLSNSSTYYYRLVASNESGTSRGERFSFNTR